MCEEIKGVVISINWQYFTNPWSIITVVVINSAGVIIKPSNCGELNKGVKQPYLCPTSFDLSRIMTSFKVSKFT